MSTLKRIEVNGSVYELRPWPYKEGRKWLFRLLTLAAAGTAGTAARANTDQAAVGKFVDQMGETEFLAFCDICEAQTNLVITEEDSRETVQPLPKVSAMHMKRRYLDLAYLLKAHVQEEFAPFFAGIQEALGTDAEESPETDT